MSVRILTKLIAVFVSMLTSSMLVTTLVVANDHLTFPGATWTSKTPQDVGLKSALLDQFAENIGGDGCVVRNGYLVKSWGDVTRHKDWASAAKPVLSTLLILAIQEKRIASIDSFVKDVGWELSVKDESMTFRQLANMTSGYGLDEPPGTAWGYNDYAIQLYAKSLEKIYDKPLDIVFCERMNCLQLQDGEFLGSRNGTGVIASPRDFARLGWLWLNNGNWNGQQILDPTILKDCFRVGVPAKTKKAADRTNDYLNIGSYGGGTNQTPSGPGAYGCNIWFNAVLENGKRAWPALPADAYQANGMWNRDTLTVIPSWNMVVASRGTRPGKFEPGNPNGEYNSNLMLLTEAIDD